jgi:hypothetical protein
MKRVINKASIITMVFLAFAVVSNAQISRQKRANNDTEDWKYEIECVGIGKPGTKLVKVWSYSKNAKIANGQAKKNAVHGMVFQGYSGGGQGCTSQKALVADPSIEHQKKEFFEEFFADGGKYMKYVSHSGDATPEVIGVKLKKYKYKVGVIVTVNTNDLRKDLEAAGVVKGLSSGF